MLPHGLLLETWLLWCKRKFRAFCSLHFYTHSVKHNLDLDIFAHTFYDMKFWNLFWNEMLLFTLMNYLLQHNVIYTHLQCNLHTFVATRPTTRDTTFCTDLNLILKVEFRFSLECSEFCHGVKYHSYDVGLRPPEVIFVFPV